MPPGGNFKDVLEVVRNAEGVHVIEAEGPLEEGVQKVTEMCVWVLQRQDGGDDAVANAMSPEESLAQAPMANMAKGPTVKVFDRGSANARWTLTLDDRETPNPVDFQGGSATALAIGVFETKDGQRAVVWSGPVRLAVS